MITCQACGTANPDTASFCAQCARKLDPATQQSVVAQRAAHTATGIRWVAVLYTIVAILVVAGLLALVLTHVL